MRALRLLAVALVGLGAFSISHRADAANRADCKAIVSYALQAKATRTEANYLAGIAWREGGCKMRYVHDNDDWTYSTFGLRACSRNVPKGQKCPASRASVGFWVNLCGFDVRAKHSLAKDVRCAVLLLHRQGTRGWH